MRDRINRMFGMFKQKKSWITLALPLLIVFISVATAWSFQNSKRGKDFVELSSAVKGVSSESIEKASPTPSASPSSSPTTSASPTPSSKPSPTASPSSNNSTSTPSPTTNPTATNTPSPTTAATSTPAPQQSSLSIKVLNIFFIPSGVTPIYHPSGLTSSLVNGIQESSHSILNYQIVDTQEVARSTTKKSDGRMDYNILLDEFNVCARIDSGDIDEVWIWVNGGDGAGFEYTASGPSMHDAYSGMKSCSKNMFVMGFDYTRTWDLALHSMGHRMEFAAKQRFYNDYIAWDTRDSRYSSPYNTEIPLESGVTGCGNVHFPPTATKHYDYSNTSSVQSNCTGNTQTITCSIWGCNQEGFLKWWFSYVPSQWWSAFVGNY